MQEGRARAALVRIEGGAGRGEHGHVEGQDDAGIFQRLENGLPARIADRRVGDGDLQIGLFEAAHGRDPVQFLQGRLGMRRQHGHAQQPIRRNAAEVGEPLVVGGVAGVAQLLVFELDRGHRTEDHMGVDAIAIHVGEAKLADARPALGLIDHAAAIQRREDGLGSRRGRRLARPTAPDLALAHPHGAPVPFLDVRRAIAQRGRKALGPEVGGELVQVQVIVTGDQLVVHGRSPLPGHSWLGQTRRYLSMLGDKEQRRRIALPAPGDGRPST